VASTTAAIRAPTAAESLLLRPPRSLWSNAWYKLRHDRLTMISFGVLVFLALLSLAADLLAQHVFNYTFERQDLLHTYEKPQLENPAYLLGSDEIGRSQVVRLLYGGRVSLAVGFVAAFVNLTVGVIIGLTAGYMRGRVDDLFTWFVTTLNSIPTIFLLLIFAAIWEPGPITLTVVIGLLFWTGISLFVFRRRVPDAPRPYRCWGYPVVPLLFVLSSAALAVNTVREQPKETLTGIAIFLLGVPVYFWRRRTFPARQPVG